MQPITRYTRTAMLLHWLVAVLILGNLALVWVIDWFPEGWIRPAVNTHKSIGLTVLGLALLRVLWRLSHPPPVLPRSYPPLERAGAHAAHLLLYGLIFALPISGYLHDSAFKLAAANPLTLFGLFEVPRLPAFLALDPAAKEAVHAFWFQVHGVLGWALYVLFGLHLAGTLKHQFVDHHAEIQRMIPGALPQTPPKDSRPLET